VEYDSSAAVEKKVLCGGVTVCAQQMIDMAVMTTALEY